MNILQELELNKQGLDDPVPAYRLEIDYQTYTETDVLEREIIYSYGYEQDLNEAKREIQLIDAAVHTNCSR